MQLYKVCVCACVWVAHTRHPPPHIVHRFWPMIVLFPTKVIALGYKVHNRKCPAVSIWAVDSHGWVWLKKWTIGPANTQHWCAGFAILLMSCSTTYVIDFFSVLPFCSLSTLRFLDWLCELLDTWIFPRGWIKNQYIYPSYRESVQLQILGHILLRELIMDNKHRSNSKESTEAVILSPHTQESQSLTTAPEVLLSLLHRECAHLRPPVVVR